MNRDSVNAERQTGRYLNRATRGLWGQARRDARLELRGAIEDNTELK